MSDLGSWLLAIGMHISNPVDLEQAKGYEIMTGKAIYAWGSYDTQGFRKLGASLGDIEQIGAGLGYQLPITERVSVHLRAGKVWLDNSPKEIIRNEVVRASLRQDFGNPPFHPTEFSTRLTGAWRASIGVEMDISHGFSIYGVYNSSKGKLKMDMWTGTRHKIGVEPDCVCWHQQTDQVDLSSFQVGVRYEF